MKTVENLCKFFFQNSCRIFPERQNNFRAGKKFSLSSRSFFFRHYPMGLSRRFRSSRPSRPYLPADHPYQSKPGKPLFWENKPKYPRLHRKAAKALSLAFLSKNVPKYVQNENSPRS